MPALPTLTVTDDQADRLLAAFGSVDNYKAWLTNALIDRVMMHEARIIEEEANADKRERLAALAESLPAKVDTDDI